MILNIGVMFPLFQCCRKVPSASDLINIFWKDSKGFMQHFFTCLKLLMLVSTINYASIASLLLRIKGVLNSLGM